MNPVPLASSPGFDLLLSIVSAAASVFLTGFVGLIAWYLRGEYQEHRKNTAVRKWLVGDPQLDDVDDGYRDQLDGRFHELRGDMQQQHAKTEEKLSRVEMLLRRLIEQYESDHDESIETGDVPFFRGGGSSRDRPNGGDD